MGEASLVEMVVVKVSPYLREDRPLLWLGEKGQERPRLLPIAIGEFEAAAIQMPLEGEDPVRPISYDLLCSMLERLGLRVRQVVIHSVRKSIYYARVVVEGDQRLRDVDSRPSDAVALALRAGAPIFVARELLDQVGLLPDDEDLDVEQTLDRFHEVEPQIAEAEEAVSRRAGRAARREHRREGSAPAAAAHPARQEDELTQLRSRLQQAIVCEQYEEAARLRDAIVSLVNKAKR
ncbi:MAG: bifunctional nuclease domain-containing protein [Candidatus Latescibacterota bacterium]